MNISRIHFLLLFFTHARITASEHFDIPLLPVKLSEEEIIKREAAAKTFYRKTYEYEYDVCKNYEQAIALLLTHFLPTVLIKIIRELVVLPNAGWIAVKVSLHPKSMNRHEVEVPLYFSQKSNDFVEMYHDDIFKACSGILGRPMLYQEWVDPIGSAREKENFEKLFKIRTEGPLTFWNSAYAACQFPYYDHEPIVLQWEGNTELFSAASSPSLRGYHSLYEKCCAILKDHNKISENISEDDLLIYCSNCRGAIKKYVLHNAWFYAYPEDANKNRVCLEEHPLCQEPYRLLFVFDKRINRNKNPGPSRKKQKTT